MDCPMSNQPPRVEVRQLRNTRQVAFCRVCRRDIECWVEGDVTKFMHHPLVMKGHRRPEML